MGESQAEAGVAAGHGRQRRQAEGARGTRRFYSHGGNVTDIGRFHFIIYIFCLHFLRFMSIRNLI